uniref:Enhancer of mRNA-decapping protein 4 WD40 repeat region domain-containing protein n=1 Tax=Meloidogyne javanica TaxID=6303 RepID=A0A915MMA4_MELJA
MIGGSDLITSPSSYIEKHKLTGSDDVLQFAVGTNVILQIEQPQQDNNLRLRDSVRASSQILTEYKWESKTNYAGRILSCNDKLIAYRLFNETTGEAVRVLERDQRFRHLIKDFQHPTVDLQWATHAPLLAVLDANTNIYIYMVDNNGQKLSKYLIIIKEGDHTNKGPARLVWCPYISDDGSENGEHEEIHLLGVVQEITACKISPDATALVVTGSDGELAFFVIEQFDDDIQIASNCRPLANNPIEELIFLDSLWKTVVLSSDNGRRLAIFDCDNWQCMAKLRFESPNQVTRMELLAEPNMHFLFVADYDLSPVPQPSGKIGPLSFAACTQISFCNPLICIVPCSLTDHSADLSLEDEDQLVFGGDNNSGTTPSTIATLTTFSFGN